MFMLNGAVYVAKQGLFKNRSFLSNETVGYIMSERTRRY